MGILLQPRSGIEDTNTRRDGVCNPIAYVLHLASLNCSVDKPQGKKI